MEICAETPSTPPLWLMELHSMNQLRKHRHLVTFHGALDVCPGLPGTSQAMETSAPKLATRDSKSFWASTVQLWLAPLVRALTLNFRARICSPNPTQQPSEPYSAFQWPSAWHLWCRDDRICPQSNSARGQESSSRKAAHLEPLAGSRYLLMGTGYRTRQTLPAHRALSLQKQVNSLPQPAVSANMLRRKAGIASLWKLRWEIKEFFSKYFLRRIISVTATANWHLSVLGLFTSVISYQSTRRCLHTYICVHTHTQDQDRGCRNSFNKASNLST